jgi:DNA-binding NtrC family response regulator
MKPVFDLINQVADTDCVVLLRGESGTGKELVADAIHRRSARATRPFIKVNCAALTETLLESELFGHERGSFTGALEQHKGRFELADGGTLFLDEIAECPPEVQVKLLRVLQEQEFERVGGTDTIRTDVRMIFATNRDLKTEMAGGRFRQDLYFRINVIQIPVAPLREHPEDIEVLVPHFLREFNTKMERLKTISPEAMQVLRRYAWPGNVRELRNAVEHAYLLTPGDLLKAEALPEDILEKAGGPAALALARGGVGGAPGAAASQDGDAAEGGKLMVPLSLKLEDVEQRFILAVYAQAKGNKTLAARMLGIGLKTLYRKLVKYGTIGKEEEPAENG